MSGFGHSKCPHKGGLTKTRTDLNKKMVHVMSFKKRVFPMKPHRKYSTRQFDAVKTTKCCDMDLRVAIRTRVPRRHGYRRRRGICPYLIQFIIVPPPVFLRMRARTKNYWFSIVSGFPFKIIGALYQINKLYSFSSSDWRFNEMQ